MNVAVNLPEVVGRCVAPSAPEALRVLVAAGAIPMPPTERLVSLAHLLADSAPAVREAARRAWIDLPVSFFRPAVADPGLPEHVLDLVASLAEDQTEILCSVLEHPAVGLRTLKRLAGSEDEQVLGSMARNQRVLCKHPELIRLLLRNPRLHPGDRSRLEPFCGDAAPRGKAEDSEALESLPPELLDDSEAPEEAQPKNLYQLIQTLTVAQKIKLATLGSKSARRLLLRDNNKVVAVAVIQSPKLREDEVQVIAQDRTIHEEVVRIILNRKDWLKSYPIRLALCQNPKTPVPKALRLLETLQDRDLRQIGKSRNVSSPVSAGAIRVLARRGKV